MMRAATKRMIIAASGQLYANSLAAEESGLDEDAEALKSASDALLRYARERGFGVELEKNRTMIDHYWDEMKEAALAKVS